MKPKTVQHTRTYAARMLMFEYVQKQDILLNSLILEERRAKIGRDKTKKKFELR